MCIPAAWDAGSGDADPNTPRFKRARDESELTVESVRLLPSLYAGILMEEMELWSPDRKTSGSTLSLPPSPTPIPAILLIESMAC